MAGRFHQLSGAALSLAAMCTGGLAIDVCGSPGGRCVREPWRLRRPPLPAQRPPAEGYEIPGLAGPDLSPFPHASAAPPMAKPKPPKPDEWDQARRLFEQLSPEQKQKFRENLQQWKTMPAAQQDLFRDRELFRREKVAQEIQDAIDKSGLHLDADQREVYALRYTQERRKIEERLHKEMQQKREGMLGDMLGRLRREFSPTPAPAATPAAAASPSAEP